MSSDILIRANKVSRYYGQRCALNDISISARKGEITALLGPNGAGKSTLMQILCGVLAASSGTTSIAGHDMLEEPLAAKAQLGYLPEQPPLYLDCTVDDYLRYCGTLRKIPGDKLDMQIGHCKEQCGLKETGRRIIGHLSKGYQQRLGLAQAILHSPHVLVLDEPGSGLDPSQMLEMRGLIRSMGRDHCILLSTHILTEAEDICDRILIINQGNIILDAPINELSATHETMETVIVAFSNPPQSIQSITTLSGVSNAARIGDNRFRVSGNKNQLVKNLSNAALSANWGLLELDKEGTTLEQIYVQLTKADGAGRELNNHDY